MTNKLTRRSASTWRIFRWPLLIGIISLIGLLSALVGDGWFDILSWCSLGGTVFIMFYAYYRNTDTVGES